MEEHRKTADPGAAYRQLKTVRIRNALRYGVFAAASVSACAIVSWSGYFAEGETEKTAVSLAVFAISIAIFGILVIELRKRFGGREEAFTIAASLAALVFGAIITASIATSFHPGIFDFVAANAYFFGFIFLFLFAILLASRLVPFVKAIGVLRTAGVILVVLLGLYFLPRWIWEQETPWNREKCDLAVQMMESGKLTEEKECPGMVRLPPDLADETGIYQVFVTHLPAGRVYFFQTCYRHGGFRRGFVYSAVPYDKLYVQKDNAGNDSTMINVGMEEYPLEMIIRPTQWTGWFHTPGSAEMNEHQEVVWQPEAPGTDLIFVLRRLGGGYVEASFRLAHEAGAPTPAARVKVFDINSKEKPLVELRAGANMVGRPNVQELETRNNQPLGQLIHELIELKKGSKVQAELQIGEKFQLSPVLDPE